MLWIGGKLQYTPTHIEFLTGLTRWITTISPVSHKKYIIIIYNNTIVYMIILLWNVYSIID